MRWATRTARVASLILSIALAFVGKALDLPETLPDIPFHFLDQECGIVVQLSNCCPVAVESDRPTRLGFQNQTHQLAPYTPVAVNKRE
jgi:hypothetical protein